MGRVSTCQNNCKTIDLRGAQVNYMVHEETYKDMDFQVYNICRT